MAIDFGSNAGLLGVAAQVGEQKQRLAQAQSEDNERAIQNGMRVPNALVDQQLEKQNQMITITPQLANGAKSATGDDSWDRAVGTKMDSRIYSSLLQYGANKRMAEQIYQGEDGLYVFDKRTGQATKIPGSEGRDTAALNKEIQKHKNKTEEIHETGDEARKTKQTPGAPKPAGVGRGGSGSSEKPEDKEFLKTYRQYSKDTEGFNGQLLAQMAKQDPKRAQELQDKMIFIEKNKPRFNQLQGLGGGQPAQGGPSVDEQAGQNKKAADWLKKNHPELQNPTDADIQWALGKMSKNG